MTRPDVDLTDGTFYAGDSRAVYRWMRENEPVFRDRNGLAAASTYQAVIEAERKPELFSNAGGIRPDQPGVEMMIEMDDPQHLLRRKLVNYGFTRKRVKNLESSITSLCDTLIDAVCERGECDFVWDLAAPLPMAVIGDMLGVRPEEREMFLKWSDDLVSSLSSTAAEADIQVTMDAFAAYSGYMMGMIEARKAEPTDDLVSVLVHAEVEGSRLEDHQIVTEVLLLLIGGDETTRHTLSGGTRQLLLHPDQHRRLVGDLGLLPNAIEEMLRWTAPVKNMARTITADTEFHGTALHEGEKIILLFESANFDEKVFEDAGELQHRALPEQPPGVRLRHALLPGQPARPARAVDHADAPAAAAAGYAAGLGCRAAAAAGELRVRPGEDAGGVHPDCAAGHLTRTDADSHQNAWKGAILRLLAPGGLAVLEVGLALFGERPRAFLGVVGQEHLDADLGVDLERVVFVACPRFRGLSAGSPARPVARCSR